MALYVGELVRITVTAKSFASASVSPDDIDSMNVSIFASTGNVNFYTAADQTSVPSSWTLLGTANQATTSGALFDSDSIFEIGSTTGGTITPMNGSIKRVVIYNGIPGSIVADFDPSGYRYRGLDLAYTDVRRVAKSGILEADAVQGFDAGTNTGVRFVGLPQATYTMMGV